MTENNCEFIQEPAVNNSTDVSQKIEHGDAFTDDEKHQSNSSTVSIFEKTYSMYVFYKFHVGHIFVQ